MAFANVLKWMRKLTFHHALRYSQLSGRFYITIAFLSLLRITTYVFVRLFTGTLGSFLLSYWLRVSGRARFSAVLLRFGLSLLFRFFAIG